MLKLNLKVFNHSPPPSLNLNTSYVEVKQLIPVMISPAKDDLNTSYVEVKLF